MNTFFVDDLPSRVAARFKTIDDVNDARGALIKDISLTPVKIEIVAPNRTFSVRRIDDSDNTVSSVSAVVYVGLAVLGAIFGIALLYALFQFDIGAVRSHLDVALFAAIFLGASLGLIVGREFYQGQNWTSLFDLWLWLTAVRTSWLLVVHTRNRDDMLRAKACLKQRTQLIFSSF